MEQRHPFWRTPALTLSPSGAGGGYSVEIKDSGGVPLATCAADGVVRDESGAALVAAPLEWRGRRDRASSAVIEIADPDGRALGAGRVIKYGIGPRARKATIAIEDPHGVEAARLEPRDKRGEQLAVTTNGTELATVTVTQVKRGFLRKSRVYVVDLERPIPDELRPLVVATAIRYDALLGAVASASMRD